MASYWELLKHPRWQRKRLEILSRADFSCESCQSKDKTLHVHHSYYERGRLPWDYPDESLHALCDDCHQDAQDTLSLLHQQIGRLTLDEIEELYGYALSIESGRSRSDDESPCPIDVFSPHVATGVAKYWYLSPHYVCTLEQDGKVDGVELYKASQNMFKRLTKALKGESDTAGCP